MTDSERISLPWPPAPAWRDWRHVTKLDPERSIDDRTLDLVLASGTDAIMIGGSTGITEERVTALLGRLSDSPVPVALEVSSLEAAMPGPALFLIPLVLNTPHGEWLGGAQARAMASVLPKYGPLIPWHLLLPEGYIVLNGDSSVARVTGAYTDLTPEQTAAYAAFAGRVLRLPLLYVEYSGRFGPLEWLQAVKENAGDAHVVYGGGIVSSRQAEQAAAIAGTIVVGNLVYERPEALKETVAATRR